MNKRLLSIFHADELYSHYTLSTYRNEYFFWNLSSMWNLLVFLFIYIWLKLFIEPKKNMFRSLVIRNHISYHQMICWIQLDFCECVFVFVKWWRRRRTGTAFMEHIQINQSIKSNWQSLNQGQIFWSNIYTNSFWYAQQTTVFHSDHSFQTHNIIYAFRYSDGE